jgi:hypothetical protein
MNFFDGFNGFYPTQELTMKYKYQAFLWLVNMEVASDYIMGMVEKEISQLVGLRQKRQDQDSKIIAGIIDPKSRSVFSYDPSEYRLLSEFNYNVPSKIVICAHGNNDYLQDETKHSIIRSQGLAEILRKTFTGYQVNPGLSPRYIPTISILSCNTANLTISRNLEDIHDTFAGRLHYMLLREKIVSILYARNEYMRLEESGIIKIKYMLEEAGIIETKELLQMDLSMKLHRHRPPHSKLRFDFEIVDKKFVQRVWDAYDNTLITKKECSPAVYNGDNGLIYPQNFDC